MLFTPQEALSIELYQEQLGSRESAGLLTDSRSAAASVP